MVVGSFKAYKVSTLVSRHTGSFALHCNSPAVGQCVGDGLTESNYLKLKGAVVAGETQVSHNVRIGSVAPFQQEREMKLQNYQLPRHLLHWLLRGPWSLISASLCICSPLLLYLPSSCLCSSLHTEHGCPTFPEFASYPPTSDS